VCTLQHNHTCLVTLTDSCVTIHAHDSSSAHCNILTATYSLQHTHCKTLIATYTRAIAISHARSESCEVQRVCVTHTLQIPCNCICGAMSDRESAQSIERALSRYAESAQAASIKLQVDRHQAFCHLCTNSGISLRIDFTFFKGACAIRLLSHPCGLF